MDRIQSTIGRGRLLSHPILHNIGHVVDLESQILVLPMTFKLLSVIGRNKRAKGLRGDTGSLVYTNESKSGAVKMVQVKRGHRDGEPIPFISVVLGNS